MENNVISYLGSEIGHAEGTSMPSHGQWLKVADLKPNNESRYIKITFEKSAVVENLYHQMQFRNQVNFIRDRYCFIAIENLIKKTEFLQLALQLSDKLITEDEFENELQNNTEKYLIQMKQLEQPGHIHIMAEILGRLGRNFNIDEVSELFSIEIQSLNKNIEAIGLR